MKAFLHHLQNKVRSIISPTYCVDGEFALNEIARATLQQYGIVQLSSATNSDSETEAATSKAVKTAYDKAVEAKTAADGKVGLNSNESINGEKSFENRIVAKRNIRISDSQHYASRGDHLNIGANNGYCWFEYKSNNREIDTLRMLTQIAQNRGVPFEILVEKVIEKSAQFAVVIGIIIGQSQAFEDRLLALKTPEELTALEQEIEQWQFPT